MKLREFPEIDFLRFLAVLMVVMFHFTARRADILPYGSYVKSAPWSLGWVGVQLFFLISGFVISHTLQNSKSAAEFVIKRVSRIYPALIIILPIVYFSQKYIPYSIFQERSTILNLLGSITLIPPSVLNQISENQFDWLTLVLWSLKVEIIFYVLCALLFINFGKHRTTLIAKRISIVTGTLLLLTLNLENNSSLLVSKMIMGFGFDYLPWFVLGMLIYDRRVNQSRDLWSIFLTIFFAIGIDASKQGMSVNQVALIFVILLFLSFILLKNQSRFIKHQVFQVCGISSYEMYLLHQGVGIPILYFIIKSQEISAFSSFVIMLFVVITLFYISFLISSITSRINFKFRMYLTQNLGI
jgi:peptidoglycan/LPS O-acetylase OafA/YrhL